MNPMASSIQWNYILLSPFSFSKPFCSGIKNAFNCVPGLSPLQKPAPYAGYGLIKMHSTKATAGLQPTATHTHFTDP